MAERLPEARQPPGRDAQRVVATRVRQRSS